MYTGPNIVTNGLVLSLDAANTKSYISGSTTWSDLSGNGYNVTLISTPTYSSSSIGTLTFNGVSSHVSGSNNSNFAFGTSDFTIDYWAYVSSFTGAATSPTFVDFRTNSGGAGYSDYIQGSRQFSIFTNGANAYTSNILIATGSWYNIVMSRIGTTLSGYFNGVLDKSVSNSTNFTENSFYLARNRGTNFLSGSLANVRVYNGRGLTASEVLQNYNATKGRFGL